MGFPNLVFLFVPCVATRPFPTHMGQERDFCWTLLGEGEEESLNAGSMEVEWTLKWMAENQTQQKQQQFLQWLAAQLQQQQPIAAAAMENSWYSKRLPQGQAAVLDATDP